MPYNKDKPQPTDQLTNSQNDILNNFISINTAWEENHVGFNDAGPGKHKFIRFPEQIDVPTTTTNELAVYSKLSTLTSVAELFVRKEDNGTEIEFTSAIAATPGWTRLPSGILLKWGAASGTGADTLTFLTGATIPEFDIIYSVQLTVVSGTGGDVDNAVRVTHFNNPLLFEFFASPRTTTGTKAVTFEYFIIGT